MWNFLTELADNKNENNDHDDGRISGQKSCNFGQTDQYWIELFSDKLLSELVY